MNAASVLINIESVITYRASESVIKYLASADLFSIKNITWNNFYEDGL